MGSRCKRQLDLQCTSQIRGLFSEAVWLRHKLQTNKMHLERVECSTGIARCNVKVIFNPK